MTKVELLAPAGSFEALIAAVQNGADAVYMGGKSFNARKQADNFDDSKLKEAVEYAHIRGVKVYLTLNTLLTNNELFELSNFLKYVCSIGIDGVIVQDFGVAKYIKTYFPEIRLHASTQMTIHNELGVKQLEELGFERVVLARELSLSEIRQISENTSAELEVFIHGALCVCYSGQCLMSSIIGGRSGNRGLCAQPCRLPYQLCMGNSNIKQNGNYILSPKDLCTINNIGEIIETGVKSLKIEGRMKRPEYVGTVVRVYRKYIDQYLKNKKIQVEDNDFEELLQIFNRGGFSKGYFYGKLGRDMMAYEKPSNWGIFLDKIEKLDKQKKLIQINLKSDLAIGDGIEFWNDSFDGMKVNSIYLNGKQVEKADKNTTIWLKVDRLIQIGTKVYKTSSEGLLKKAIDSYNDEKKKIKLKGIVKVKLNNPINLVISDSDGNNVIAEGNILVEQAINKPLTNERLIEQINKLGNTPFEFEKLDVDIDKNVSVSVSEINNIRRQAIEKLIELRKRVPEYYFDENTINNSTVLLEKNKKNHPKTKLSLYLVNLNNFSYPNKNVDRFYISFTEYLLNKNRLIKFISDAKENKSEIYIALPRILRQNLLTSVNKVLEELSDKIDGVLTTGIGQTKYFDKLNLSFAGDFSYNVFNTLSIKALKDLGIDTITISPELNISQLKDLVESSEINTELIVCGRLPLMISEYCPVGSVAGGRSENAACKVDCSKNYSLIDRMGNKFQLLTDKITCQSQVLNTKTMFLGKQLQNVLKIKPDYIRINMTIESEEEINQLINFHKDFIENGEKIVDKYSKIIDKIKNDFTKGHYFRGVE